MLSPDFYFILLSYPCYFWKWTIILQSYLLNADNMCTIAHINCVNACKPTHNISDFNCLSIMRIKCMFFSFYLTTLSSLDYLFISSFYFSIILLPWLCLLPKHWNFLLIIVISIWRKIEKSIWVHSLCVWRSSLLAGCRGLSERAAATWAKSRPHRGGWPMRGQLPQVSQVPLDMLKSW